MRQRRDFEDILVAFQGDVESLENLKLPSIEALQEWRDFKDRKLTLDFDIDVNLGQFIKYILLWNKEDKNLPISERKSIYIYISSSGGDLQASMTFIDVLKMSKTPIKLICLQGAYSAAGLIFMCKGENITRCIMPHGKVLIHQGSVGINQIQTHQFLDIAGDIKKGEEKVKSYILENTNITSKTYNSKKKDEWALTADECLKYGVCDKIIEDISELI